MLATQPAILAPAPLHARILTFSLALGAAPGRTVDLLAGLAIDERTAVGLGEPLSRAVARPLEQLRTFPALTGSSGVAVPSTQQALWVALGGDDAGEILHRGRQLVARLSDALALVEDVACYRYGGGRDLSGYEDGTENPKDEAAVEAAIVAGRGEGLDGGSFVAVQRWVHTLSTLERLAPNERDLLIGRSRETNEELEEAPPTAHVKRAAQESFEPPAFMVRRSMPWGDLREHGLYFVAYGKTLDPFERVLQRMVGLEDGISDGLLRFSRPVTGGYYFCPPLRGGALDLRALRP